MADKRNFNKAEVARLIRVFIESKTTGFKSNHDKEFMLEMLHLNKEEFEKLEKTTRDKVREFYINGCDWSKIDEKKKSRYQKFKRKGN